jgi:hypothetical protein
VRFLLLCLLAAGCATVRARPTPPGGRPCVDDDLALRLPFTDDTARLVIQGNGGAFSHSGLYQYAWDFEMPEGTPVAAAAEGVVAETVDGFTEGAPDRKLENRANLILVDHGGARFSVYQHLQPGGILVHEGDRVLRGQPIGKSGNTGFTSRPHLHFAVIDHRNRSQPVCFRDVERGVPVENRSYRAAPLARPLPPSLLPRDAFAENGLELTADLPARDYRGGERIEARALRSAARAIVVFYPRERDGRERLFRPDLADGRFSFTIDASILAELGARIDFMLALEQPDGSWHSDFSVPIHYQK